VCRDQDALHRAVNDIRAVKTAVEKTLAQAHGKPHGGALASEGGELLKRASAIEGVLMQVKIKGSEADLNFPGMLNEQIYGFAGVLEDADTAPNEQEVETYADLHARLGAQLKDWSALRESGLSRFCTRARDAGYGDSAAGACR
jgi:hypothetical protein